MQVLLLVLTCGGIASCAAAASTCKAFAQLARSLLASPHLLARALLAEFGPDGALQELCSAICYSSVECRHRANLDTSYWAHIPSLRDDATVSATLGELIPFIIGTGDSTSHPGDSHMPVEAAASLAQHPSQRPLHVQPLEMATVVSLLCTALPPSGSHMWRKQPWSCFIG